MITAGIPQALQFKVFNTSRAFPEFSPQYGWGRLFFQKWFRGGPLRAGHGISSSTEDVFDFCFAPPPFFSAYEMHRAGPEKGVITKGVFSLEESLESLESLEITRISREWSGSPFFPRLWSSLESLEYLHSLESLENAPTP